MKFQFLRIIVFFLVVGCRLSAAGCPMQTDDCRLSADSLAYTQSEREHFQYLFLEALCQQEKGNIAGAFDLLKHCESLDPNASEIKFMLSKYYLNIKDMQRARDYMEKASQLAPKNDYYKEMVAEYCIQNKEYDKAIKAYEDIYENNHERGDILNNIIGLASKAEKYDKAIWALNRLETLEGKSETISMTKYRIYLAQKADDKALDVLQDLANTYTNDLNYTVAMGDFYQQHSQYDKALEVYQNVLSQEPNNISAQLSLYQYYLLKQDTLKSAEMVKTMLKNKATKPDVKAYLLRLAIEDNEKAGGDSLQILKLFYSVQADGVQDATMLMLQGYYMEAKKMDKDSILAIFKKVVEIEPDNAGARIKLVAYAWDEQDYDEVIKICTPARQYNPDELSFYYYQGVAYMQIKETSKAIDVFQRGISTINESSNPDIVSDFYAILGDLYFQTNRKADAYNAYDSCLQWKADNIGCMNNYAYYLSLDKQELDKAEKMSYQTIVKESSNATFLDTYAWVLFMEKKYAEAKIYIDKALANLDTLQTHEDIYAHAGDIYFMVGETEKAVEYWTQASKINSTDKLLLKKIRKRRYYER